MTFLPSVKLCGKRWTKWKVRKVVGSNALKAAHIIEMRKRERKKNERKKKKMRRRDNLEINVSHHEPIADQNVQSMLS